MGASRRLGEFLTNTPSLTRPAVNVKWLNACEGERGAREGVCRGASGVSAGGDRGPGKKQE